MKVSLAWLRIGVIVVCVMGLSLLTITLYPKKEREKMELIKTSAMNSAIPPLDASAPARTETATFALG